MAEHRHLLAKGGVGSMLNVIGAEATRATQEVVVENSRLRIPLIFGYDVVELTQLPPVEILVQRDGYQQTPFG